MQKAKELLNKGTIYSAKKALEIYKTEYIKSLLKNEDSYRIEVLRGLIKASKRLKKPYGQYKKELYSLIAQNKTSGKKSYKKPKVQKNRLKKVILRKGYVEFYFDFPITSKDISFKRLKIKGTYKNIYDIKGRLGFSKKIYRLKSVKQLKIAQYNPDTIRIVFENSKPIFTKKVLKGSKLEIYLDKKLVKNSNPQPKIYTPIFSPYKKIVVIDPGHGGKDSGAVGYKRKKEKDVVLAIAKRVYTILKQKGYKVYLTRKGDYFVSLRNRTKFANRVKANLFISIHANAAPTKRKRLSMKGIETFFLSPTRSERAKRVAALENRVDMKNLSYFSKSVYLDFLNREKTILSNKLAIDIQRNILSNIKRKFSVVDGGVRPGPFWVLVGAQMPAVLIETGYITNPTEAMRLSNPYYQKLLAEGVAKGIESFFIHNK